MVNPELDMHSFAPICVSTIRTDVEFLKSEEGNSTPLKTLCDDHETYLRYTNHDLIVSEVSTLLEDEEAYERMSKAVNPYGDGKACGRIVDALKG